jgi:transposase, IS5 family
MRFLVLQLEDRVPDAKTFSLFRERLKAVNLVDVLFACFHKKLASQGYVARAGQMSVRLLSKYHGNAIRARRTPNSRLAKTPRRGRNRRPRPSVARRTPRRWTSENKEKHYGYKNNINADQGHKLIQSYKVTSASVHDSEVFDELLD